MPTILQADGAIAIASEQERHSNDQLFLVALKQMVKKEIKEMIWPSMEDLVRKIVKEEIQSNKECWTNKNVVTVSNERSLYLKFLDEVCDVVLTGKEIREKSGNPMKVEIVDETGKVIESGPESSAKVEILLLEAHGPDNEHPWSQEDFNSTIINNSDKKKPHFAQSCHVYLEKGVGVLSNAKLANDSHWTKSCKCRLGGRVVDDLSGIKVKEAWTKPFLVSDSRGKLYGKRYPPSPSDPVWRLVHIGRDGVPCKRLNKNKVSTVEDFLFLQSVDPQKLQEIVGAPNNTWNAITNHATTCNIDDRTIRVYPNPSEGNMSVVFDAVGKLKGLINDSQYVTKSLLSEAEKDRAHELLCSAFENRDRITFFGDETTLVHRYPYRASNSIKDSFPGIDLTLSGNSNLLEPSELALQL